MYEFLCERVSAILFGSFNYHFYVQENEIFFCGLFPIIENSLFPQFWKLKKVFKATISWRGIRFDTTVKETEAEAKTRQYDQESMRYLSYILYPLCIAGAIYSLIYQPHKR